MLRFFWPHGYRNVRIPSETLPRFGRINLLVGPNSAGKSNFLKAMSFLPEMLLCEGGPTAFLHTAAAHGYADAVNRARRTERKRSGSEEPIVFYWLLGEEQASPLTHLSNIPDIFAESPSDLLYTLGYQVGSSESFPKGFFIGHEGIERFTPVDWWSKSLSPEEHSQFKVICHRPVGSGKGVFGKAVTRRLQILSGALKPTKDEQRRDKIELPVDSSETVLRQTKELLKDESFYSDIFPKFERASDELHTFARGFHSFKSSDVSLRFLMEGAKLDLSARTLDSEGRQFVNVLRYLDQQHDFLDEYASYVRELVPDLKKLKIVDASDIFKQLDVHIGSDKFRPYELSDGTLRAMWLALLLFSPEKGSVLALDEPELSLHPAWLKIVGGWLQRFRSAQQIFISTHSPDLLDAFTEGFRKGDVVLFVFDLGEKGMHRLEPGELDEFFKEGWQLGDLYRIAEPKLGGWPW